MCVLTGSRYTTRAWPNGEELRKSSLNRVTGARLFVHSKLVTNQDRRIEATNDDELVVI
jgi:hypothetical protein